MYSQWQPLLIALSDPRAAARLLRWPGRVTVIALILTIGEILGLGVYVWLSWPTMLLTDYFGSGLVNVIVLWTYLTLLPITITRTGQTFATDNAQLAMGLRHALEAGDDAIAPLADAQTVTPAEQDDRFALPPAPTETLALAFPTLMLTQQAIAVLAYIFGFLFLVLAALTVNLTTAALNMPVQQLPSASVLDLLIPLAIFSALMLVAALLFFIGGRRRRRLVRERRGITLTVDGLGVSFRQPTKPRQTTTIAWGEMRALAMLSYKDIYTHDHVIYLLDGGAQTLLWEYPPTELYAMPDERDRTSLRQESSRTLARLIAERTRLPLRNLTATMTILRGTPQSNTSNTNSRYTTFLRHAYRAALIEGDLELATALWQADEPGARRQPRALRQLTESAHRPSGAGMDTNVAASATTGDVLSPRGNRFARWWAAQVAAVQAQLQPERYAQLQVARALLPHLPTSNLAEATPEVQRFVRSGGRRQALTRLFTSMQVAALLCVILGVGAFWLGERYLNNVIGATPQQIMAETPTYFAPLSTKEPGWSIATPTKNDPGINQFSHGAYHVALKELNYSNMNWVDGDGAPQSPEDVALSSTVAIHGSVDKAGASTAGVMFDVAKDGNRFTAFGVDMSGDWTLWSVDFTRKPDDQWTSVDIGSSDAIHTGDGATNIVMVVRHGPLYLLYVNGVLMERFYDRDHALRPGGLVGVYIDDGDISADFNNFTVFPIPQQLAAIPISYKPLRLPWAR